jgi:hypothetical protein
VSDDLLLPEGARLVHVGPQKTGTTSIQVAMAGAREVMAAHGAYYPKGPYRRRKAGWALGLPGAPGGADVPIRHWENLVNEVRAAGDRRVCVSDESFARAEPPIVERIVSDLGGGDVHVVAVARRLDRYLPSQWQERVKTGYPFDFETWLRRIFGDGDGDGDYDRERWNVWQGHDVAGLVERWLQFVEPDRFTLVIADESDRLQLSRVFESMLGLPDGTLQPDPQRSNKGLSWGELEVLRGLRRMYEDNGWPTEDFGVKLKPVVASLRARPEHPTGPRTPSLPAWALDRIRTLSEERADAVAKLPVRVIGDPDWLRALDPAPVDHVRVEDLSLPVGLVVGAVEGMLRAERAAAERNSRRRSPRGAALEERPAGELSGRELLRLAQRRLGRRLRRD